MRCSIISSKAASLFSLFLVFLALTALGSGCSLDTARSHYLLAEKLWQGKNYAASVVEFERAAIKDPRGELGLRALYRAAMTQSLFLGEFSESIRNFSRFVEYSGDSVLVWDAQLQIGDLLFTKLEQYDQSIVHYEGLIQRRPTAKEVPELMYRIGKARFYLFQFEDAIATFRKVAELYQSSPWAEKAAYEIGLSYFTQGEESPQVESSRDSKHRSDLPGSFRLAQLAFAKFIARYPKSPLVPQAQFGIAGCLEETNQVHEAYEAYGQLKSSYPSPRVIQIKLDRLKARIEASKLAGSDR